MNNHILIVDDDKSHGPMLETLLKNGSLKFQELKTDLKPLKK